LISEEEAARHEIGVVNEIWEEVKALEAIYTAAVVKRENVRTQVAFTRGDLGAAKRELERVIHENSKPHAPIVRSRPHAA